jgi:hypothetical protein
MGRSVLSLRERARGSCLLQYAHWGDAPLGYLGGIVPVIGTGLVVDTLGLGVL